MALLSTDEARSLVMRELSGDWLKHVDPDEYTVPRYGWRIGDTVYLPDGPAEELDVDDEPVGLGLAVVDLRTGRTSRTTTSEIFRVMNEGEEFGDHPED